MTVAVTSAGPSEACCTCRPLLHIYWHNLAQAGLARNSPPLGSSPRSHARARTLDHGIWVQPTEKASGNAESKLQFYQGIRPETRQWLGAHTTWHPPPASSSHAWSSERWHKTSMLRLPYGSETFPVLGVLWLRCHHLVESLTADSMLILQHFPGIGEGLQCHIVSWDLSVASHAASFSCLNDGRMDVPPQRLCNVPHVCPNSQTACANGNGRSKLRNK